MRQRQLNQSAYPLVASLATALLLLSALPHQSRAQGAGEARPIASFDSAWVKISRTYWDTLLVEGAWRAAYDSIRATLRPTDDDDAIRRAIRALIAVPGQSHFTLIPGSAVPEPSRASAAREGESARGPGTLGLQVRSIGDTLVAWRVLAGGPAEHAGIRAGDQITAIDSLAVDTLRARIARSSGAEPAKVQELVTTFVLARLGGQVGDSTRLTFSDRSGSLRTQSLVRIPMTGRLTQMGNLPPMVVSATLDSVSIGRGQQATLIAFSAWLPAISPQLDSFFFGARHAAGLIIDLRGNPGGVIGMVAGVSGHLLDTAIALGVMHGRGATIKFVANPRRVDRTGAQVGTFTGPVAVLVDGFTGSTSEFFAAGMQAVGRVRIFGDRSAGQSLPALLSRLPNGDVLMHAIADHEDAIGRRVEGAGVQPDELVPLRRVDLQNGRDAPLEAARAWIAAQQP